MTQDHPDAIAYRRAADAFRIGDLDLVKTLIAPEVVRHLPREHHMAGTIDGRWVGLRSRGGWLS